MIEKYPGNKYSFEVKIVQAANQILFSITAIHKKTRHYSYINTLNTILSEFGISGKNTRTENNEWLLSKFEFKKYKKILNNILIDSYSAHYLESKLDEDRSCGEWENKCSLYLR